ncbi:MAG: GMC family oxidoreductase [Actinobacteria bacterium]|nr:GMC family oxidoreductase [Actinomycetota bacterium]
MPSERCDVLVIGSGPSGAIVTHTLASRGFDVVCLEQGDWVNPSDFPANQPEWELLCEHAWAHDPNQRKLPADYPLDVSASDLTPVMFSAVGGASLFYGAHWLRLLPSDFRLRSLDGICDDWPISYDDLKPYHDEVDKFIGASGLEGDPAYPEGLTYPRPPHPPGPTGLRGAAAANELGWHWWPGANAIAVNKTKTLEPCARRGTCEWGCPEGAKSSFDLIYMPQALQAGAKLIHGARVREVTTEPGGLADGAIWLDRDGVEHHQRARVVVLCANGIGTPRLLLLSGGEAHPDGLANSSGLVGRNLMLHPNCLVTGYYDDAMESWLGPAGQLIHSMEFYETRPEHDFPRGCKLHLVPIPGPLTTINVHRELPFDAVWGDSFHGVAARHAGSMLWAANTEDLPEESNRIVLDPDLTDDLGVSAPKVEYQISEDNWKILRFAVERMEELHRVAGAAETFAVELDEDQPGHLLGTARMGDDPASSVVDSFGRSHDVPNLFIADGSVFVTGGSVNPTCTIAAIALRVGTHIAETADRQPIPS